MVDDYGGVTSGANEAATKLGSMAPAAAHETVTITTSVVTLEHTSRAIWVGTGGTVSVNLQASTANPATFANVPDGTLLPIRVTGFTTLTTATDIVSLY